jgi:hypothetical protein
MFINCRVAVPAQLIFLQLAAETIDIIKRYTGLPEKIMDDLGHLACIIDNPENGILLDSCMHRGFNTYTWCLHPTVLVWLDFCREISDTYTRGRMFCTNIQYTGSVVYLRAGGISQKFSSRITLKLAFHFPTLRSLRSTLRLPMSYISVVLQKS